MRGAAAVGAHDALGLAGRATRVGEAGDLVAVDRRRDERLRLELRGERDAGPRPRRTGRSRAGASGPGTGRAAAPPAPRSIGSNTSVSMLGVVDHVRVVVDASRAGAARVRAAADVSMLAPMVNSTSGRFGDEHRDRAALGRCPATAKACVYRLISSPHLAGGEHLVAEVHAGLVGMARERRDEQVGHVRRAVQSDGEGSRWTSRETSELVRPTISERASDLASGSRGPRGVVSASEQLRGVKMGGS